MRAWQGIVLVLLVSLLSACGGGGGGSVLNTNHQSSGGSSDGGSTNATTAVNQVGLSVDATDAAVEPSNSFYPNIMYTTITVCVPGGSTCQQIDHVMVDTGSSGLRLIASSLGAVAGLLPTRTSGGQVIAECLPFVTSYTWGTVNTADLHVAGETASSIPVQVVETSNFSIPGSCAQAGEQAQETAPEFGANGIIGVGNQAYDCGINCADNSGNDRYYLCTAGQSGSCSSNTVALADQLPNPITRFAADSSGISDNNGSIITLPPLSSIGAVSASGTLTFGISTRPNNQLGSAAVHTVDGDGLLSTLYRGNSYNSSYVDSGTGDLEIPDDSIPVCKFVASGYSCPLTTDSLLGYISSSDGSNETLVGFSVANAATLFNDHPDFAAFNDLADTSPPEENSFAWGAPFFYGRSVFTGIQGQVIPGVSASTGFVAF